MRINGILFVETLCEESVNRPSCANIASPDIERVVAIFELFPFSFFSLRMDYVPNFIDFY